ncbi:Putative S-adenosyl-L-methionine-dependent methyltransferase [Septoria linicola]|uniref:S-adenosyl-L-methionine-dependent methyltransferase n=1 Tax=Septoria linicola TaxID=215465 RepID=A0A9Q9B244_9PEZI|nr:putative S-adenosyl-L-methionine-dependent methyltransferase [Septoria linicola]USW57518.1 Putative S-adenosyl-L-methionine-dependent methyltransferase [Septoria linicola]
MSSTPSLDSKPAKDPYPLGRNALASARLNLQHLMWTLSTPSLLHPSIPITTHDQGQEPVLIADIGTGTGIWSTTLSPLVPPNTPIHAFDISLSQTPSPAWTPANVSFHQLDIMDTKQIISQGLEGKFDIVHVRLLMLIVQNNDPMPLLRTLMSLLKPGGYFQWQEYDSLSQKLVIAPSSDSTEAQKDEITGTVDAAQIAPEMEALRHAISSSTNVYTTHAWIPNMSSRFSEVGGTLIAHDRNWTHPTAMLLKQDTTFLVMGEWCATLREMGRGEEAEGLERLSHEAEEECWRLGRRSVIDTQMVTWVVRKDG